MFRFINSTTHNQGFNFNYKNIRKDNNINRLNQPKNINNFGGVNDTMIFTNNNIVIARYNEDTSFIKKLDPFNIFLYEKEKPEAKYNIPKNKGNEASAYLKYIIDNYNRLTTYTIFIHCHEFSWHHRGSIVKLINSNLGKKHTLTNLNGYILDGTTEEFIDLCLGIVEPNSENISIPNKTNNIYNDFIDFYTKLIVPATGNYIINPYFSKGVKGCAQFIVHRDVILSHSVDFYKNIYDWLLNTTSNNWWNGRYLEWTWDLFWNKYKQNMAIVKYKNEYIEDIENIENIQTIYPDYTNKKILSKEELITQLEDKNYFYIDENSIKLSINNDKNEKRTCIVKNKYIYNKYL
jgi:hypothetical protein